MAKYAEAECATCYAIRPKSEMREVKVERIVGKSHGGSNSTRSGRRNYSSFGSSGSVRFGSGNSSSTRNTSSSRTRTRVDRVWVCRGCRAPRSDGWFGKLVSRLAIAAVLGWLAISYFNHHPKSNAARSQDSKRETSIGSKGDQEARQPEPAVDSEDVGQSAVEPTVVFAPPKEVVQPIPNASDEAESTCGDNCAQP